MNNRRSASIIDVEEGALIGQAVYAGALKT
jgi:hypothetical protein